MDLTLIRSAIRGTAVPFATVLVLICLRSVVAGQSAEAPPNIASRPFSAEQLTVYRTALVSWYRSEKAKVNLGLLTEPIATSDDSLDKACLKGLSLEAAPAGQVHRIRPEDLIQLGPFAFHLVDPKVGSQEVSENDPGHSIQKGKPVDEAVENGFAHGLLTLGEIQFDKGHNNAVVSFSFQCGRLCGNGTKMLMAKKDGVWKRMRQCGGWVS